MDSFNMGRVCEDLAANYYKRNGYRILERNYRSRDGEIDIIACKDGTLVFAEVKSVPPSWDWADLQRKIPPPKILRIKKTASQYLASGTNAVYHLVRFDAVFVCNGRVACIRGAF